MALGRTFLPTLANSISSFSMRRGGTRYFQIELSSQYRWYVAPIRLVLVVISGIIVASIIWSATQTVMSMRERHDMQARLDRVRMQNHQLQAEAQQEGINFSGSSLQQLPAEVTLANQLLAKRHFSWTQFLSALEAVVPQQVSIRSIHLDPGSAIVHIIGLAVTVEDVTALTVTLQDHAVFRDPVLGQHRMGPDGLVEFDLTLRYRQPDM